MKRAFKWQWIAGGLLTASSLWAVSPSIWQVRSQSEFAAGEPADVAIDSRGFVTLSPSLELMVDTEQLYIWSVVAAPGGLFAGTGNQGKIFKLDRDGDFALLADLEEPDVLSLVRDGRGGLFAGASGSGTIYHVDTDGGLSTFYETGERYVWSMVVDARGNLLAGTGDKGRIYKISADGSGTVLFDSPDTHIMSLVQGSEGQIYAGSEGSGLVYRISPEGDPFVLYDAPEKEIRSLAMGKDGTLYVAAIAEGAAHGGAIAGPALGGVVPATLNPDASALAPVDSGREQEEDVEVPMQEEPMPQPERAGQAPTLGMQPRAVGGGGVLYKIEPDGVVTPIWSSANHQLLSLSVREDGKLLLGTGDEGAVHLVDPHTEEWIALARLTESHVTAVVGDDGKGTVLACANMGTLHRLGPGYVGEGTLESTVHNTSTWSKFGRVWWEEEGGKDLAVEIAIRSGNSEEPDSTWSSWSKGLSGGSGQIESPNARFVQWKAKLMSSNNSMTPELREVSVSYQQRNLRPRISFVTVGPRSPGRQPGARKGPGPKAQQAPSAPQQQRNGNGRPARPGNDHGPLKGVGTVKWSASDANGDQLQYSLFFRGMGESEWKPLKEDLEKTSFSWDSETLPDGKYRIKVVASDEPSNATDAVLIDASESEPFVVDNTPPSILDLKVDQLGDGRIKITGIATDSGTPLKQGSYAVNGGDLSTFFPTDAIFDSQREPFSFSLGLPTEGEHTLMVRVVDLAGNVSSRKTTVSGKK